MLKKTVQQGRSERRAEAYPLGYVEGLNDARTTLADFFSILLDPWVHPFRSVLRQLLIVAPQVGMVVIELRQKIVQFRGILCLYSMGHAGL